MRRNLKAYNNVNIESTMLAADPHKIVLMMLDGALESMAQAKGAIERKDLALKSKQITKSVNILTALRSALDKDAEPVISKNFDDLYSYCINKLNDASVSLDIAVIDEVHTFLVPLRDAWKEMPESSKQEGIELLKKKDQPNQVVGA
jgi:flagellar protein FliS